ncbi:MAG: hypothetical protein ACNA70_00660 [Brevefilum sp.]
MQRLRYALRFISACFSRAMKFPRLRKPWLRLWMGGVALLVLWLIPMGVVMVLLGIRPFGMFLLGLFTILLLFCLLAWGELLAVETCLAFDDLIWIEQQLPGSSQERREFAHWQDVLLWVLILPGLEIIRLFNLAFRPAHTAQSDWLTASYLMLPAIALEDFRLKQAIERVQQLERDHLLRFQPGLVGIRPLAGVVQWGLILGGGALGLWAGLKIADPVTASLLMRLLALFVGVMLAGVLAVLGIHFSSFYRACYYTTLYQWVLNVENARMTGDASVSSPPVILSQVMNIKNSSKKE